MKNFEIISEKDPLAGSVSGQGAGSDSNSGVGPRAVRLLSSDVIHRIAAGEVVDRPASVLKELLDNSIDAKASRIKVQIIDGGLQLLEVDDNGWGIGPKDLAVCAQRHATSKIDSIDDLDRIFTLGFRGEALSAVAAVSRLKIDSFRTQEGGWVLEVVGGDKKPVQPSSRDVPGTRIQVRDLFFNIPARKKFLKKSSSEAKECLDIVQSVAIAHPAIDFEYHFVSSGGEVLKQGHFEPSTFSERFAQVMQLDGDTMNLIEADLPNGLSRAEIVVFLPPVSSHHQKVWLSVNGRPVIDKRLPYALRESFLGLIEQGAYPIAAIRVVVDPSIIDVNIHPQKKEIRWPVSFSLPGHAYRWIRSGLQKYVQPQKTTTVESMGNIPAFDFYGSHAPESTNAQVSSASLQENGSQSVSLDSHSEPQPTQTSPSYIPTQNRHFANTRQSPVPPFHFRSLRIVGEIGAAWIVGESEMGLVLIDQHAAHERVQFERILSKKQLIRTRPLLIPVVVKVPFGINAHDPELLQALEALGFELSDRSKSETEFEIVAVPEADRSLDWTKELNAMFESVLREQNVGSAADALKVKLAASLACHGSVRRGQRLKNEQIAELMHALDEIEWGGLCPHGRPLWHVLQHGQIESLFHR